MADVPPFPALVPGGGGHTEVARAVKLTDLEDNSIPERLAQLSPNDRERHRQIHKRELHLALSGEYHRCRLAIAAPDGLPALSDPRVTLAG